MICAHIANNGVQNIEITAICTLVMDKPGWLKNQRKERLMIISLTVERLLKMILIRNKRKAHKCST